MNSSTANPWLHKLALLLVVATFALIFIGGMVTSKGAGLAVPDWPLSYGSLNPPGWMHIENVRLEHGHRLFASFVGLLTTLLAIGLWRTEDRLWVRWLGVGAFLGVLAQGILGGLRVNLMSTALAIVHACVAQAFFCLTLLLAMVTSSHFISHPSSLDSKRQRRGKVLSAALFLTVYAQIIAGALMRHWGAGLAIPDFPLAFGRWIPPLQDPSVLVHFIHRVGALLVTVLTVTNLFYVLRYCGNERRVLVPIAFLSGLLVLQIFLGAQVIWLARPPIVTTLHVLTGALILGTSFVFLVRSFQK